MTRLISPTTGTGGIVTFHLIVQVDCRALREVVQG